MSPHLLRAAHASSMLLAADPKDEDVSGVGHQVIVEDSAGLVMWVGVLFLPLVAIVVAVGAWAISRARDISRAKENKGEEELEMGKAKTIVQEVKEPSTGLKALLFTKMNIMLIFVPLGFLAHFLHWSDSLAFFINCLSMLPLAALMGIATEELACHTGQTIGGLLNATFGNAVELIFVVQSLRKGLITITKGTLLGSILANELLVLGMALLFGGLFDKEGRLVKDKQQKFSYESAMIQSQLLLFSSFMVVMPSMFEKSYRIEPVHVLHLSRMGSVFAMIGYGIFMVFQLYTHAGLLRQLEHHEREEDEEDEEDHATISVRVAVALLTVSTLAVAIVSEFLVHSIDGFAHELGLSQTFIGVVLLPIIGNACEHSTAIIVALKDKVTLSISIAIGSTIQVSLFVVPFAVIVGWILDKPMSLDFHRVNSWALVLSSLLVMSVLVVGKSTWMNGFVLITAYAVLAFLYFLSPDDALA